jgi:prepilin-type N-terminal cleavage/methylation domain-containing protein
MSKKGFTLVELLVVIAIIALLMGILMPALARVRQIAFRMTCGTNLSGIGKAMLIYANDYEDELPRAGGRETVWGSGVTWDALDRFLAYGLDRSDGGGGTATISSCFYLLVKYAEVTPKSFICKGDSGAREFNLADYPNAAIDENIEAWDFGPTTNEEDPRYHCSYSYHLPFCQFALTSSSEPGMAVAADRNPWILAPGQTELPIAFTAFKPDTPGLGGSTETAKNGNAVAHQNDGQQVLFMDMHVDFEKRAYCAVEDDNIYTLFYGTGYPQSGDPPTSVSDKPTRRKDSFLVNDFPPTKGGRCFPADTLVWINEAQACGKLAPKGLVEPIKISDVTQGQYIGMLEPADAVACSAQTVSFRQVERVEEHEGTFQCYDVVLETGDCISVASSHLFLLDLQRWVPVQDLKTGLKLRSLKGPISIKSVVKRATPLVGKVYNLKIKDAERYCVGRDGVIVRDW